MSTTCGGVERTHICALCGRHPQEACPKGGTQRVVDPARMEKALLEIGYAAHSGLPRFGPKAQTARWGLGRDSYPTEEERNL